MPILIGGFSLISGLYQDSAGFGKVGGTVLSPSRSNTKRLRINVT
jgi:hypothetical protein